MKAEVFNQKFFIGTSWKMNKTNEEAVAYIQELAAEIGKLDALQEVQLFVLPPFTAVKDVAEAIAAAKLPVLYGAQNVCWAENGAWTGEVSADMLKALGCSLVEVNHQERRKFFNETNETANLKIRQILKYGMRPIVCFGDEERCAWAETEKFLQQQMDELLAEVPAEQAAALILAYEPRWAIGKAAAAPVEVIDKVHSFVRGVLTKKYGRDVSADVRILYGGSVTVQNARAVLQVLDVDGLFIGRAALTATGYVEIVRMAF